MVCDFKKKKKKKPYLQYYAAFHTHFEVEGIYNFKLFGVYKMHKPDSKCEQLLMLRYCCCASNRSRSHFNFQVAAWIQCYKWEFRSFVLVCDDCFFHSVLTRIRVCII